MANNELLHALELLISEDPLTYEEAYLTLSGNIDDVLDNLLDLEQRESDTFIQGKLIELIGESTHKDAVERLCERLGHASEEVRGWAYSALKYSESEDARQHAKAYEAMHPSEAFLH